MTDQDAPKPEPTVEEEIAGRFGVLPNFFRLAPDGEVTSHLWGFARFAYIDNPLPSLFKERLFVYLSMFCDVRYCISRHVGFLTGLGNPAGDPDCLPESLERAAALLQRPLPRGDDLEPHLARLGAMSSPPALEALDDGLEESMFACITHVFLQTAQANQCLSALQNAFEPAILQHLLAFLAFVRVAHFWTETHPELKTEQDVEELLKIHEPLNRSILHGPTGQTQTTEILVEELRSLRREQKLHEQIQQTNVELLAERERLRVTLASIGDAVITTDDSGRVTYLNAVAETLTGWHNAAAEGRPLDDIFRIINQDTRRPVDSPAGKALREGVIVGLANHTLLISKSGEEHPIDDSAAPISDINGNLIGCVLVFRDVSQRRALERENNERLKSAQLLASIIHSSNDAIISKTLDGVLESWNGAAERLFGYRAEEALGRHVSLIIPPDRANEEIEIIQRISSGERFDHFDAVRQRKDGHQVPVSLTVSPVIDGQGNIVGASSILRDISERKHLEEQLSALTEALSESHQRKDEFLATLAHELRNPLAPIRTGLELLRVLDKETPAHDDARAMLERQVSHMVRLVDDLMDVSRISQGRIKLEKVPVELAEVVQHAVETSTPIIEEMRHELIVSLPSRPIVVEADIARLSQVLSNLLNNGAKYSEPGSQIWLSVDPRPDTVVIRVRDAGIGLESDKLSQIFDMFSQVDQSVTKTRGGLGIGLTLARTLVEMHGGSIEATSAGLGQGTEFVLRLPCHSDLETAPQSVGAAPRGSESDSALHILIIDDNEDAADSLAHLLELVGHRVDTAYDGPGGLALAETLQPDVVLLDIGLPRLSGYEVSRGIRQQPWSRNCRIVAVTGWGADEDRRKSREMGVDVHLVKPVDPQALMELLAELDAERAGGR